MPEGMPDGIPIEAPDQTPDETSDAPSAERRHLAAEKKNQRYVWWYLAYFLFGIHIVAFVMIYAISHAK
ncbi:hypothetical protein [Streptomyces olivochromogenes]|uniref:Uncharacterized protein n=1 Tax=Streptomyces olivochromogenes TaxID=1963 RepID=A0A250VEG7_STROL|nr:hypothetical protein [Streptomyces olivochromogenes]GAX52561.1 hypothetical protein SO3561_04077 [Streptomyces olivochromogenes]